ncbi:MAG TPA: zinc ribbon domain-containing protein, partial [Clostridia bacterium]|nr:zinc ribbon domain-containing protein [Clostridia bacterium]
MICPNCGTELPDNAKFCLECGRNFLQEPNPEPESEPESVLESESNVNADQSKENPEDLTEKSSGLYNTIISRKETYKDEFIEDEPEVYLPRKRNGFLKYLTLFLLACLIGTGGYIAYDLYLEDILIDYFNRDEQKPSEQSTGTVETLTDNEGNTFYRFKFYTVNAVKIYISAAQFARDIDIQSDGLTQLDIYESELIAAIPPAGSSRVVNFDIRVKTA